MLSLKEKAQDGLINIIDFIDHNYPNGRPKNIQAAIELIEKELMDG